MKPITASIDVSKVLKEHLVRGKQGGVYLDLVAFPLKSGPDDRGNTHVISQSVSKAARESGVKGPILGRIAIPQDSPEPPPPPIDSPSEPIVDDVPF